MDITEIVVDLSFATVFVVNGLLILWLVDAFVRRK